VATRLSTYLKRAVADSPLRLVAFRRFYFGSIGTAIGYTMQATVAAWLMATLTPSALMVALVQTASTSPSLLFGLWHVAPSLRDDGLRPPPRLARHRWAMPLWVGGTVLVTAAGGAVFSELRQLSGSLIAPMGLHWATNGLGSAVRLWAR